jgi:hypothetical protein
MIAPIHLLRLLEIYSSYAMESCYHLARKPGILNPVQDLLEWGLIRELGDETPESDGRYTPHGYGLTDAGYCYVEKILSTNLPVQKWYIPGDN